MRAPRILAALALGGLLAAQALIVPTSATAASVIAGSVLGNGATPAGGMTGATHAILGTVGQPVVGLSAGAATDLCEGFWCFGGVHLLSVEGPAGAAAPAALEFGRPSPNPMRDRMTLVLALPRIADARVRIVDVAGRAVGEMHAGRLDAGTYRLEWDGTDGEGHASGPGVYFAALQVDGRLVRVQRFVRLR